MPGSEHQKHGLLTHIGMRVRPCSRESGVSVTGVGVGVALLNLAVSSAASGPWPLDQSLRGVPVADFDGALGGRRPCLAVPRAESRARPWPGGRESNLHDRPKSCWRFGRKMGMPAVPLIYITQFEVYS